MRLEAQPAHPTLVQLAPEHRGAGTASSRRHAGRRRSRLPSVAARDPPGLTRRKHPHDDPPRTIRTRPCLPRRRRRPPAGYADRRDRTAEHRRRTRRSSGRRTRRLSVPRRGGTARAVGATRLDCRNGGLTVGCEVRPQDCADAGTGSECWDSAGSGGECRASNSAGSGASWKPTRARNENDQDNAEANLTPSPPQGDSRSPTADWPMGGGSGSSPRPSAAALSARSQVDPIVPNRLGHHGAIAYAPAPEAKAAIAPPGPVPVRPAPFDGLRRRTLLALAVGLEALG